MEHYLYKVFDYQTYKIEKTAKAFKKKHRFFYKHYKKFIGFVSMMSFAIVLKTHLH